MLRISEFNFFSYNPSKLSIQNPKLIMLLSCSNSFRGPHLLQNKTQTSSGGQIGLVTLSALIFPISFLATAWGRHFKASKAFLVSKICHAFSHCQTLVDRLFLLSRKPHTLAFIICLLVFILNALLRIHLHQESFWPPPVALSPTSVHLFYPS